MLLDKSALNTEFMYVVPILVFEMESDSQAILASDMCVFTTPNDKLIIEDLAQPGVSVNVYFYLNIFDQITCIFIFSLKHNWGYSLTVIIFTFRVFCSISKLRDFYPAVNVGLKYGTL